MKFWPKRIERYARNILAIKILVLQINCQKLLLTGKLFRFRAKMQGPDWNRYRKHAKSLRFCIYSLRLCVRSITALLLFLPPSSRRPSDSLHFFSWLPVSLVLIMPREKLLLSVLSLML